MSFLWVFAKTFNRDLHASRIVAQAKLAVMKHKMKKNTIPLLFDKTARDFEGKVALILAATGERFTFKELNEYSNQVANLLLDRGFGEGDVVALFMENSFQYVGLWLGMAKIGVEAALINTTLRQEPLVHCVKITNAKAIVFGSELTEAVCEIHSSLGATIQLFCSGDATKAPQGTECLEPLLDASSITKPKKPKRHFKDRLFYIFTSGTTGLPEAAIILHRRYYRIATMVFHYLRLHSQEVMYTCLPFYHSAGTIIGIGQCLLRGMTVVIRDKFSAPDFWGDCSKYYCTIFQYSGEMCRLLLREPIRLTDQQHWVKLALGSGLRKSIWEEFSYRFNINKIVEFYGATEGNCSLCNFDNRIGACGFISRFTSDTVTLVKVDKQTKELLRCHNGLCVSCKPGQQGMLVGQIIKGDNMRTFDGYIDEAATKKKIAHNVFQKGDTAYLSGDVFMMDSFGWLYFKDRVEDNIHWKLKNVSTADIESTLSTLVDHKDVVVYGVDVPKILGKAVMAAIADPSRASDLDRFVNDMRLALPALKRPMFLRFLSGDVNKTGTFKFQKAELRRDGFNPKVVSDKLYFLDPSKGSYIELNDKLHSAIMSGEQKLG